MVNMVFVDCLRYFMNLLLQTNALSPFLNSQLSIILVKCKRNFTFAEL